MNAAALPSPLESETQSNRLVITMWLEASGEVFVRSCEVIGSRFRNRTSFGERASLETAFSEKMAQEVRHCISRLTRKSEVLVMPTYAIELPNLTLGAPRIVTTQTPDGSLNIIMRFKSFMGSINAALRDDIGLSFELADQSANLAAKVLGDIAAPLLNICASAEASMADVIGKLGEFGRNVTDKSHEIKFQVELLNRFVEQQSKKAMSPDPNETLIEHAHYDASRYAELFTKENNAALIFHGCAKDTVIKGTVPKQAPASSVP